MPTSAEITLSDEPTITITRIFDAPRELVFMAWTDPDHLAHWWEPTDLANSSDPGLCPGTPIRVDHFRADGTTHPGKGLLLEIVTPERLVYTDLTDDIAMSDGSHPPTAVHTVTFEEHRGKTKLRFMTHLESIDDRDALLRLGAEEDWSEHLEGISGLLARRLE